MNIKQRAIKFAVIAPSVLLGTFLVTVLWQGGSMQEFVSRSWFILVGALCITLPPDFDGSKQSEG